MFVYQTNLHRVSIPFDPAPTISPNLQRPQSSKWNKQDSTVGHSHVTWASSHKPLNGFQTIQLSIGWVFLDRTPKLQDKVGVLSCRGSRLHKLCQHATQQLVGGTMAINSRHREHLDLTNSCGEPHHRSTIGFARSFAGASGATPRHATLVLCTQQHMVSTVRENQVPWSGLSSWFWRDLGGVNSGQMISDICSWRLNNN